MIFPVVYSTFSRPGKPDFVSRSEGRELLLIISGEDLGVTTDTENGYWIFNGRTYFFHETFAHLPVDVFSSHSPYFPEIRQEITFRGSVGDEYEASEIIAEVVSRSFFYGPRLSLPDLVIDEFEVLGFLRVRIKSIKPIPEESMSANFLSQQYNLSDFGATEDDLRIVDFVEGENPEMMRSYYQIFQEMLHLAAVSSNHEFYPDRSKLMENIGDTLQSLKDLILRNTGDPLSTDRITFDFQWLSLFSSFALSTSMEEFEGLLVSSYILFCKKQYNYGSGNISLGEDLSTKEGQRMSLTGLWVRCNDKSNRLQNLINNGREDAVGESVRDTWQDLSVYGIIAQMVVSGKWGK